MAQLTVIEMYMEELVEEAGKRSSSAIDQQVSPAQTGEASQATRQQLDHTK